MGGGCISGTGAGFGYSSMVASSGSTQAAAAKGEGAYASTATNKSDPADAAKEASQGQFHVFVCTGRQKGRVCNELKSASVD